MQEYTQTGWLPYTLWHTRNCYREALNRLVSWFRCTKAHFLVRLVFKSTTSWHIKCQVSRIIKAKQCSVWKRSANEPVNETLFFCSWPQKHIKKFVDKAVSVHISCSVREDFQVQIMKYLNVCLGENMTEIYLLPNCCISFIVKLDTLRK